MTNDPWPDPLYIALAARQGELMIAVNEWADKETESGRSDDITKAPMYDDMLAATQAVAAYKNERARSLVEATSYAA